MKNIGFHIIFTTTAKAELFIKRHSTDLGAKKNPIKVVVPGMLDQARHYLFAYARFSVIHEHSNASNMAIGQHSSGTNRCAIIQSKNLHRILVQAINIDIRVNALFQTKHAVT